MKMLIDVPNYNLNDIQNGSIACGQILKAIKNGRPYQERPQGEWLSLSDVSPSGFGTWVCSQCGQGFRGIKSKMPYCTCGADMRGDGNGRL